MCFQLHESIQFQKTLTLPLALLIDFSESFHSVCISQQHFILKIVSLARLLARPFGFQSHSTVRPPFFIIITSPVYVYVTDDGKFVLCHATWDKKFILITCFSLRPREAFIEFPQTRMQNVKNRQNLALFSTSIFVYNTTCTWQYWERVSEMLVWVLCFLSFSFSLEYQYKFGLMFSCPLPLPRFHHATTRTPSARAYRQLSLFLCLQNAIDSNLTKGISLMIIIMSLKMCLCAHATTIYCTNEL